MSAWDVMIVTDGSSLGNPGPGGWAAIMIAANGYRQEYAGGESHTTSNRMEITALLEGLKRLKRPCRVLVIADSKYVINAVSKWMPGWKRRGWVKSDGEPVLNADLFSQIDALLASCRHQLTFQWQEGHVGHELNERADLLARGQATRQRDLLLQEAADAK